jgi:transmembrane sensor
LNTTRMNKADDVYAAVEPQAREWMVRLRSGNATQEDAAAFQRWCAERPEHARVAAMIGMTWGAIDSAAARVAAQDAASGQAWTGRSKAHPLHRFRPGRRAFAGFAVAAGASWLALRPPLGLWPGLGELAANLAADYRTGTGEQRQVAVADRVVVSMNTQTRIDVLSTGSKETGINLLAGEAEVATGGMQGGIQGGMSSSASGAANPFVVVAGRGRLQARNARFDVRRDGDAVCVTCVSGSVTLDHPRQKTTLSAAQQLVYDDHGVRPMAQVDPAAVTAWRRGLLVFDGVPLSQVVDEINRYRPGKLVLRNATLGRRLVQAKLSIAELDRAIGMIHQIYGVKVTELPGNIVLLG